MVKQYPHTVTISSTAASTQDANGDLVAGTESSFSFSGRFETNSRGNFLKAADGKQIVYSGIIYSSLAAPNVPIGASITVSDDGGTIATGNVMQVSRGQLNVRIWI